MVLPGDSGHSIRIFFDMHRVLKAVALTVLVFNFAAILLLVIAGWVNPVDSDDGIE